MTQGKQVTHGLTEVGCETKSLVCQANTISQYCIYFFLLFILG